MLELISFLGSPELLCLGRFSKADLETGNKTKKRKITLSFGKRIRVPRKTTPLNQRGILLGVTTARHYVRQGPKLALFLGVFGTGCQFLYLARCGGPGRKMLDLLAFFDSAPFSLMARCANFPEIIEKIPSALAAPAQPASYLP
jgi:hypothetical protein